MDNYCGSYIHDIYPDEAVTLRPDVLVIETDPGFVKFKIVDNNTINISRTEGMGQGYPVTENTEVFYDPGADEIRVIGGPYAVDELFELAQAENCTSVLPSDNRAHRENKAKAKRARKYFAQGQSIGEFDLGRPFEQTTFPVYNARKGLVIGQMNMSVRRSEVEGSDATFAITPANSKMPPSPNILYRAKYYPSMLVFDRSGSWFNISSDPKNKMWINGKEIPTELLNVFTTREEVMLSASVIEVKSAHRLRAESNTNSEILKVLQPREHAEILPLEIEGDWMRVRYISPESHDNVSLEELRADPRFTVMEGWIKWRESAKKQYVEAQHYYGR